MKNKLFFMLMLFISLLTSCSKHSPMSVQDERRVEENRRHIEDQCRQVEDARRKAEDEQRRVEDERHREEDALWRAEDENNRLAHASSGNSIPQTPAQ